MAKGDSPAKKEQDRAIKQLHDALEDGTASTPLPLIGPDGQPDGDQSPGLVVEPTEEEIKANQPVLDGTQKPEDFGVETFAQDLPDAGQQTGQSTSGETEDIVQVLTDIRSLLSDFKDSWDQLTEGE